MRLQTPRLLIRSLDLQDVPALVALWTDPEVTRYMGGPRDAEDLTQRIEEAAREQSPPAIDLWPVIEKASSVVIGHCGLVEKDVDGRAEVELTYVLARQYWGSGYANEAAAAIRDYAFEHLGLTRLIALIDPENAVSAAVARKLGMRRERETIRPNGRRMEVYAIEV